MTERPSADDLEARLGAEAAAAAGPGATASWLDGPEGLRAVIARVSGASSGTGWRSAVVTPDGAAWAHWRPQGLAALAAHLRWFEAPPSAGSAAFALDFALWDGLDGVGRRGDVAVSGDRATVTLTVEAPDARSLERVRTTVQLSRSGHVDVRRQPVERVADVLPIDGATRLERALADDDGGAIQAAVSALRGALGDRDRRALARVALVVPGMTGADAVMKLTGDPQGLATLRAVMAETGGTLAGPAREIADALWGAGALG